MSPRGRRPRGVARALVALLVASAALAGLPSAEAAATRTLAITGKSVGTTWQAFDGNPPKAFDIDGDGRKEILAQNDNQNLYVFSSADGRLLATLRSTYPAGWGARTFNGPEAYREDGVTHVVQHNSAAVTTSWRFDPAGSTVSSFRFVKEWERRATDCFSNPGSDSKPTLADLDRDGKVEIVVSTEEVGIYALRQTGQLYWKKCIGGGNAEPRAADLDLDGWLDVVFASDGGIVTAMKGRCATASPCTPTTMWSYDIRRNFNVGSGSVPVGAGIGQLDGLGGPDVVVGARDSHNSTDWSQDHALLLALSSSGVKLWAKQDTVQGNPLTYTHPIVADAEGDGRNEVYWGDWNTVGHYPPGSPGNPHPDEWMVVGPACDGRPKGCMNVYRYDHQGNMVWRQTLGSFWSNKDLALADVDGDGSQEVLANGPGNGHDGIWALGSATGAKETFIDLYPWMMTRGPVLYDLAGDGGMDLVVESGPMATSDGAAVLVYDLAVAFSALWPHVPASPTPSTVTSTSSSSSVSYPPFDATFSGVRGNEWWIQANAATNGAPIVAVDVRVNGGSWLGMDQQSWGPSAWGASFQIRQGSVVQLRATASDGQVDLGPCHQWIPPSNTDATVVPCPGATTTSTSSTSATTSTTTTTSATTTSATTTTAASTTTSAGPGAFDATFSAVRGNEWWVQADVRSNGAAVTAVAASVDGGAWKPLAKQSWGPNAWAASFQVPQGSQLQLRATASDGSVDLSATCYQWVPPSNTDATQVACRGSGTTTTTGSPPTTTTTTSATTTSASGTSTTAGSGAFDATFSSVQGNEWWVQANVRTNGPAITGVDARVDGGVWKPLAKQSWGPNAWAASFQVPQGSLVQLRATASDGSVDLSATCYQWIPASGTDATQAACRP